MKSVVVSGGTKGIGRAIVLKFLEEGFTVYTYSRNQENLQNLEDEACDLAGHLHTFQADGSKQEEVKQFAEFVFSTTDNIEVLVNNTGVFIPGEILKEEEGVFETTIQTNLHSAYYLTREIVPNMVENKRGSVFNICSTASIMAYPNGGSYCISKYALLGMTKVLREELKGENVKVTAVLPGATMTASWEGVELPEERFIKPEDIADTIWATYQLSDRTVIEEILVRPQLGDL